MKRYNGLFQKITAIENLELADKKACKRKKHQYGVKIHRQNQEANLLLLQKMLVEKSYKTSPYSTFKVYEPKEREVYRLPYFPDRITHHAIMNVLEPIFVSTFTADTYSCIKRRGIHAAARAVRSALRDEAGTKYCLKLDITKFYPSVNHEILKNMLRRKIKDQDLLSLLGEIIDSAPGLPIGNYLSQYLANFYLTGFDHWIKEAKAVKYYFRYADDLVILAGSKSELHDLLIDIKYYLDRELKLQVKPNHCIFPVAARGIDFVGYVFFHTHTLLRKSIKKNFARMVKRNFTRASLAAYWGWAKHANSKNLIKKLLIHEKVFRFQHCSRSQRIRWRQSKNQKDSEPGNNYKGVQDRIVQVPGERRWKVYANTPFHGRDQLRR